MARRGEQKFLPPATCHLPRAFTLFLVIFILLRTSSVIAAPKFKDMPDDHWAARSVYNMVRLGVTRGYPDGTFRGSEKISRYQLMVYLSNLAINMEKMMDEKIAAAKSEGGAGGSVTMNKVLNEMRAEIDSIRASLVEYQQTQGSMSLTDSKGKGQSIWDRWVVTGDYTFRVNSFRVTGDEIATDYVSQRARLTIGRVASNKGILFEIDTGYINPAYQGLAANMTSNILAVEAWVVSDPFLQGVLRFDASGGPGDFELNDYPSNGIVTRGGTVIYRPGNAVKATWSILGFDISERYEKRVGNVDRSTSKLGYTLNLGVMGTMNAVVGGECYSISGTEPTNSQRSLAELTYTPITGLTLGGKGIWFYSKMTEDFEYFSQSSIRYLLGYTDTEFKVQVDRVSDGFYADNVADEIAAVNVLGYKILPSFEVVGGGIVQYFLDRTVYLAAYGSTMTCMLDDRDAINLFQENDAQFEGGWYITPETILSIMGRNTDGQIMNNDKIDWVTDNLLMGQFSISF